ncbi:MAG: DNA gyrase inhibitor YacG [Geminicoccales bacterium]
MSEDQSQPSQPKSRTPRCPLCGRPRVQRFRPFCSARCRDIDLGRWFTQSYTVPVAEPGEEDDS